MKHYKNIQSGTIDTQENWAIKFHDPDGDIDLNQVPSLVEVEQNSDNEWIEVIESNNIESLPLNELGQYLESRKPLLEANSLHSAIVLGDMDANFFHNKPELDYLFDLDRPDSINVPEIFSAYSISLKNTKEQLNVSTREDLNYGRTKEQVINNYQISDNPHDFNTYNDYRNILIQEKDVESVASVDAEFNFFNPEYTKSSPFLDKEDVIAYNHSFLNKFEFLTEIKNEKENNFQLPKRSRKTKSTDIENDLNL